MEPNGSLRAEEGKELEEVTMYRQIAGSLIYLTLTRHIIAYVVGVLSRFIQAPRKPHLKATRLVLRYVKSTLSYGVKIKRELSMELIGFCNADYAKDPNTRRCTTGKRQPTVSFLTTEAKYRTATMAAQECVWLVRFLNGLIQVILNPKCGEVHGGIVKIRWSI
ncbi:secreted RxLR effector protein 161-like [Bidens hawaiensis]|uniref:secreted RxLR effector protein 161-like n=1 Tax=Bidens hawaiensis TaxID=980011 RepID=UPI00404B2E8A